MAKSPKRKKPKAKRPSARKTVRRTVKRRTTAKKKTAAKRQFWREQKARGGRVLGGKLTVTGRASHGRFREANSHTFEHERAGRVTPDPPPFLLPQGRKTKGQR